MKVTLIDYTGKGHHDHMYAARLLAYTKSTRLTQGVDGLSKFMDMPYPELVRELDYISKTLRSSWEFVDFTFQIEDVTRAFTHQLVRTRTASYAQQAQRVVDLHDFTAEMPETVKGDEEREAQWNYAINQIKSSYGTLQESGVPNQDCRGLLPTNVHTNIIMKANLRTLADLLGKRKNLRAQGEFGGVAKEMERVVLEAMPWCEPFLSPDRTRTPALDKLLASALGSASPVDKPALNEALKELDMLKGIWG